MTHWHAAFDEGLQYRFALPTDSSPGQRWPLVVFLHGSGESGDDNQLQLKNGVAHLVQPSWPAVVVAPQCPAGQTWGGSWYGGRSEVQDRLVRLTRALMARSTIDAQRVYAVGFSMGAIGLWDVAVRQRHLFTAALTIAGDLDVGQAQALLHFPLWAFHGAADELVSPANERVIAQYMQAKHGQLRYTELPGRGHDICDDALTWPGVMEWLFSHRRQP